MENLTMSDKRKTKLEKEANATPNVAVRANTADVTALITKCEDLIAEAATLYLINSNKELNDAIIILHSAMKSLNLISPN